MPRQSDTSRTCPLINWMAPGGAEPTTRRAQLGQSVGGPATKPSSPQPTVSGSGQAMGDRHAKGRDTGRAAPCLCHRNKTLPRSNSQACYRVTPCKRRLAPRDKLTGASAGGGAVATADGRRASGGMAFARLPGGAMAPGVFGAQRRQFGVPRMGRPKLWRLQDLEPLHGGFAPDGRSHFRVTGDWPANYESNQWYNVRGFQGKRTLSQPQIIKVPKKIAGSFLSLND